MRFINLILILSLLTPNFQVYAVEDSSLTEEAPLVNLNLPSPILCVNRYYQNVEAHKFNWTEKVEKAVSAGLSSSGMLCMYFLGAEFINNLTGIDAIGYSLGPVFEAPVAVLCYEAQNGLYNEVKKKFDSDWKAITNQSSAIKKLGKGATFILVSSLGAMMSSVGLYYSHYYLEPIIGSGFWVFVPATALSYTIVGSLGTLGLVNLFKEGLAQTVFQRCQSNLSCKREDLKKIVSRLITKIQNESDEEVEVQLQQIRDGNMCEVLTENADHTSAENSPPPQEHSPCYEKGKVIAGLTGGVISIVGSIAMIPATTMATNYLLEAWFGVDPSISETMSWVCGCIGGLTTAGFRGKSSAGTFRLLYDKIGSSCDSRGETTSFCSKIKNGAIEGATWVASSAGIAPKIQFILNSMERSLLEDAVLGCSAVATVTSDYFAWRRLPAIAEDLFVPKTARKRTLAVLNEFSRDIDHLSEEVINAIYDELMMSNP